MAIINHIRLGDLEDETRFDPQYYTPENMLLEKEITAFNTVYLGSVAFITDGQHGYFRLDENSEIRYITAKCIKDGLVDKANAERLSHYTNNNSLRSSLAVNDVLVTTAGTIGQIGLVTEEILPANIDQDIGRIAIHNDDVSPHFVWAFLQSKFGRFQIERFTTGQVQTHLSLKKMRKLRIPLLPQQQEVKGIVEQFVESRTAARGCYTQAQQLLESELGLDKLRFDKPVGYTARFSEMELSRRFDSEHYYPAFDNLKEKLPKHVQFVPFGLHLTYCQRGKQPVYSENGFPVLNSKHILENKISLEGNRFAKPNLVPSLQIQYGDVLINGTGRGTIGRTAPYLISEHQAIPDNHVTILRSSTLDPAYLSFYLNSQAGKLQVEKHQRGSSGQLELYPFDIRRFQVWEAPQSIQQEIRRLYEHATESARQSRELLNQAKSRVEQLIEEAVQS